MRYVLHPGYVISRNDGGRHFVDAPRLARLYGIDIRDSAVVFGDMPDFREQPGDVHLRPRRDGDYRLPLLANG